jgi:phosphoenolpyruvate carboxylase
VYGETLELAVGRQAGLAFEHYFAELHQLHDELAQSARQVEVTPELTALADAAQATNPGAGDEAYRTALKGMYARLAETAVALVGPAALPAKAPHRRGLPAYATPDELLRDLNVIRASLDSHGSGSLAVDRLDPLIRAVSVFGFQ